MAEASGGLDIEPTQRTNHLLLIGIDQYQEVGKLANAVRDAKAVRDLLLTKYTFSADHLTEIYDAKATRRNIMRGLRQMITTVQPGDNLLVYFSGHGHFDPEIQEAYWVPVDAEYEGVDDYISYSFLTKIIKAIKAHHAVFIVDSCYSGAALVRERDLKADRFERDPSRWLLASGRNEVVPDGEPGSHSPFADKLISILDRYSHEGLRLGTLTDKLTTAVTYNSRQTPIGRPLFDVGDQGGEFIFYPRQSKKISPADLADWQKATEAHTIGAYREYRRQFPQGAFRTEALEQMEALEAEKAWQRATRLDTVSAYDRFLDRYPDSSFAAKAEKRIEALLGEEPPAAPKKSPQKSKPKQFSFPVPEMVPISGGTFQMGSNEHKEPIHQVTLDSFELGKYPVTQREWQAIMGENPSKFKGDDRPVEKVSWDDCQKFIQKLNEKTGLSFRLPTEAEWEYAAGGGPENRTKWASTDDEAQLKDYAWYDKNSDRKTQAVGKKEPNPLGLYDLSGNVWEWCQDRYGNYPSEPQTNPIGPSYGDFRVVRGGSWDGGAGDCRVANRFLNLPYDPFLGFGFRLARTP